MINHKIAALFAGQGVLQDVTTESELFRDYLLETFREIDRVAHDRFGMSLSRNLTGSANDRKLHRLHADAPELIQLAVFGYSAATYAYQEACGWCPSVMVGHGFGEILALVCGGAFSVSEGAEIVCERAAVLERTVKGVGSMIAVAAPVALAEHLVRVAGIRQAAIAADNSEMHSVISGSYAALDSIMQMARTLDIGVKRLAARYPLHCAALMSGAAEEFAKRLEPLISNELRVPVFSPILCRYYDDISSPDSSIAEHLIKPIRFLAAVYTLRAHGINEFGECGVLKGLAGTTNMNFTRASATDPLAA